MSTWLPTSGARQTGLRGLSLVTQLERKEEMSLSIGLRAYRPADDLDEGLVYQNDDADIKVPHEPISRQLAEFLAARRCRYACL